MEFFVLLLAVGAATSEKLHLGNPPPPSAKFAGGSSLDLQTPLEYPKETPTFESRSNKEPSIENTLTTKTNEYLPVFNQKVSKFTNDEVTETSTQIFETLSTRNEETISDIQSTLYPTNQFETTVTPFILDMGYTEVSPWPLVDKIQTKLEPRDAETEKQYFHNDALTENINYEILMYSNGDMNYIRKNNGNFNLSAMAVNNLSNHTVQKYQPDSFGMYGGKPMIIKHAEPTQDDSRLYDNNANGIENPSEMYKSSQIYGYNYQKPVKPWITSSPFSDKLDAKTDIVTPVKVFSKTVSKYKPRKFYRKQPRPQTELDRNSITVNNANVITLEGYTNSFDTSNGIHKVESATTVNGVKAVGSYSYTGDDGKVYSVSYSADENGFKPRGDHLPLPPPIPKAIEKVIEQANRDKEAGIVHDGSYDEGRYGHMKYQGPIHRYLQKQKYKTNYNRNRVVEQKKQQRILVSGFKAKEFRMASENIENKFENNQTLNKLDSNNNYNMQFIKTERSPKQSNNNVSNTLRYKNRRPIMSTRNQQDSLNPRFQKPSANDFNGKHKGKGKYRGSTKYLFGGNIHKATTPKDEGYFYVPPRNVFIEGRFQDKTINELSEQHESTQYNTVTTPIAVSYDKNEKEPNGSKSNDKKLTTTIPSNKNIVTMKQNEKSTPVYSFNQGNTDVTGEQDAISTEILDTFINHSTTPMPSQVKYTNIPFENKVFINTQTFDYRQTDNENDYHDEYFKNTPEEPAVIENLPTSNQLNDASNKVQKAAVKVDGFGRTIDDNQYISTNLASNEFGSENYSGTTESYSDNFQEILKLSEEVSAEFSEEKEATPTYNKEESFDKVIGEDFTGPKQPQAFDSQTGYFY